MSTGGQGTKWLRKIAEIFNCLSRVHERYRRQTTYDRQTDGQTEFSSLDLVCIPCSPVKTVPISELHVRHSPP